MKTGFPIDDQEIPNGDGELSPHSEIVDRLVRLHVFGGLSSFEPLDVQHSPTYWLTSGPFRVYTLCPG